jgi:RNA binding exosome subunit
MSILHNVRFRTFAHATEDRSRVEAAITFVSGSQNMECEMLKGHHGNPLAKITAFLKKRKDLDSFLSRIKDTKISPEILGTLDRRVDGDGTLYIRLSKQAAYEGRIETTEKDDAISVRAKVKAYPANRAEAIRLLRKSLKEE